MIASRIGRAGTRFGPTRFGGSSSAMIGSAIAHSSSGTRQIGGNGGRSFFFLAILHLRLSRPCRPGASLEIVTNTAQGFLVRANRIAALAVAGTMLVSSAFMAAPAQAQNSPGGCTTAATGGPAGSGNRGGRQDSAANLPAVIAAAVQDVASGPIDVANLSGTNVNLVCLN